MLQGGNGDSRTSSRGRKPKSGVVAPGSARFGPTMVTMGDGERLDPSHGDARSLDDDHGQRRDDADAVIMGNVLGGPRSGGEHGDGRHLRAVHGDHGKVGMVGPPADDRTS